MKKLFFLLFCFLLIVQPSFASTLDVLSFDADHDKMLSAAEMKAYLMARAPKGMSLEDADKYFRERANQMQVLLEWRDMADGDFTRIDKNGDRKVDKKEFIAAYPQAADSASKLAESYTREQFIAVQLSSLADVMKKFDITKDELDERARAAKEQVRKFGVNIAAFDSDNDGVVTVDELKIMHQRMFTLIPNAGDGILTFAEYAGWQQDSGFNSSGAFPDTAKLKQKFDDMDANHDGKLTASEYAAHEAVNTLEIYGAMAKQDFSNGIPLKQNP